MSHVNEAVDSTVEFRLPLVSAATRDTAVRLATACFTFETNKRAELQPAEVGDAELSVEARRISSIADAGERQEAVGDLLRDYVRLAGEAQKLAIELLSLAKSVDALSAQLHDVKESAKRHRRPR